jgi:hypothetical protein
MSEVGTFGTWDTAYRYRRSSLRRFEEDWVIAPLDWLAKIDAWRKQQPEPMPNLSEAYRRLIEEGLEAEAKGKLKRRGHD